MVYVWKSKRAGQPRKLQGEFDRPNKCCMLRASIPDSPQRKMKATVPTKGGSTNGSAASAAKSRRPGKVYRSNKNASGTPTSPHNRTVDNESTILLTIASRTFGCVN